MAETVILLAIKKIGIALGKEATQQLTELQGGMGRVMMKLRVMHDSLCQMDMRYRSNQVYEAWLEEVCKVAYFIEDMVDEYLYLVGRDHDVGWCCNLKKGIKKPKSLLSVVQEAEKNLAHLSQTKERWFPTINKGDTTNSNYIVQKSHDLASISRSLGEDDLVVIEDNKQTLVQWLRDDELARSVIVLYGMGGLVKMALAATVYRKEREKFDCHAWVSISQTYTREDVLQRLIVELFRDKQSDRDKQCVPSNIATMDTTAMQETLKMFLDEKKYLVTLDGVCTPEAYNDLFGALPSNLKGSRIIITTRVADVAHLAFPDRILRLEPLSKDESWELFCKKAFPDRVCPTELKTLSMQIAGKCEGLPLAIVCIGSLLFVRDKTVEEWRRINHQLSWEIINNSRLDQVRNVLLLSFIYLPTYLKGCFLYCSLFPDDYLFQRKKLVRLWIAEGFIEKRGQSTIEEVAEGYLKELVHRNMLQLIERNSFGRIRSFRMHDILRGLAVDLCRRECFGVAYEEDNCGGESLEEKDGRRLAIHKLMKGSIPESISSAHQFRSVIALDNSMPSSTLLPLVAEKCRYMSVLELSGLPIEKVPDAIGDLFNLRHLGLRDSKVKLLPKSIEKLSNLLTLDLMNSNILELPPGITKLKKLRHLFVEAERDSSGKDFHSRSGVCIPMGLGNLTNLQTLRGLEAEYESIRHLGDLRQLRSIRIRNVKQIYCECLCESLVQMQFLSYLFIAASDEEEDIQLNGLNPPPLSLQKITLRGRLAEGTLECPLFQTAGQNLFCLCLSWSQLTEDPLPRLSQLSNLMVLDFTRAYSGEQLAFHTGWFPKLKTLSLFDLPNLKRLKIQQGAMASLEKLELRNLKSMTEVPDGIEFLMRLQYLAFDEISPEFLTLLSECSRIVGMRWWHSLRD